MKTASLLSVFTAAALAAGSAFGAPSVGSPAPDFSLKDADGQTKSLSEYKGKYVVLEWTNPDCPIVQKHYKSGNIPKLQQEFTKKGVVWLSIDSSASGNQGYLAGDEAKKMREAKYSAATDLLLDPDGTVGHLYHATNTPDMFIIDPEGKLVYAGAIDSIPSSDQSDIAKATNYVQKGLEEAMSGKPLTTPMSKAYGCSVKY